MDEIVIVGENGNETVYPYEWQCPVCGATREYRTELNVFPCRLCGAKLQLSVYRDVMDHWLNKGYAHTLLKLS